MTRLRCKFALLAHASGVAVALAGCASGDGVGTVLIDPGKYLAYHCDDMGKRLIALRKQEKDLVELMNKASTGTGGTVIGALSYRTDYESALTEQRMLQRAAAAKSCVLEKKSQSDEFIR